MSHIWSKYKHLLPPKKICSPYKNSVDTHGRFHFKKIPFSHHNAVLTSISPVAFSKDTASIFGLQYIRKFIDAAKQLLCPGGKNKTANTTSGGKSISSSSYGLTSIFNQELSRIWTAASKQPKVDNQPLAFSLKAVTYPWVMLEQVFADQMSFLASTNSD